MTREGKNNLMIDYDKTKSDDIDIQQELDAPSIQALGTGCSLPCLRGTPPLAGSSRRSRTSLGSS